MQEQEKDPQKAFQGQRYEALPLPEEALHCLPALRAFYSTPEKPRVLQLRLTAQELAWMQDPACRPSHLDYSPTADPAAIEAAFPTCPHRLLIQGLGLVAFGYSAAETQALLSGEPLPPLSRAGRVAHKTMVITGAAQGFGLGIAQCLAAQGANIVVADVNPQTGMEAAAALNAAMQQGNRALFVRTDVSDPASLRNLMGETVRRFGGLDAFISNAGILRAGGLDQMTPEVFERVTKINYSAYFFCAQAASAVMKVQAAHNPELWYDLIQINSKSGLRGSKANFAYAGGKFGGLGLTQSFALELVPFRIKVNAICPGNYYEGPLWSDPENGLFVQYLKAGKVPGAQTVEDVRAYYLAQVPMKKGCSPLDVTRAVLYAIEQTGETGQAIPVTGGQVMLG